MKFFSGAIDRNGNQVPDWLEAANSTLEYIGQVLLPNARNVLLALASAAAAFAALSPEAKKAFNVIFN